MVTILLITLKLLYMGGYNLPLTLYDKNSPGSDKGVRTIYGKDEHLVDIHPDMG